MNAWIWAFVGLLGLMNSRVQCSYVSAHFDRERHATGLCPKQGLRKGFVWGIRSYRRETAEEWVVVLLKALSGNSQVGSDVCSMCSK